MLKRVLMVMVLAFALGLVYVGCGDSDDDGNAESKCATLCEKSKDCEDQEQAEGKADENSDGYDQCMEECKSMAASLETSVFNDIYACANALDDLCDDDKVNACFTAAASKCKDDKARDYYQAYCEKMDECGQLGDMSVDDCVAGMEAYAGELGDIINCVKDSKLDEVKSCVKNETCEGYRENCNVF